MKCEHRTKRTRKNASSLCRNTALWMVNGMAVCTQHRNHFLRKLYATRLMPGWEKPVVERIEDG